MFWVLLWEEGAGSRLHPLTKMRSKPAVPIAGKYRLIDIPISNCINSGIFRVAILTQFNSVSLHRHISQTYNFDVFHTGWVEILGGRANPRKRRLVSGHGGCCAQAVVRDPGNGRGVCVDPGRRSSLSHGLCRHGGISLGEKCRYNGGSSTRRKERSVPSRDPEARVRTVRSPRLSKSLKTLKSRSKFVSRGMIKSGHFWVRWGFICSRPKC